LGTAVVGTVIRSVITAMPAGEHFTPWCRESQIIKSLKSFTSNI
jgi:hypothetical protein